MDPIDRVSGLCLIPNFITDAEERELIASVDACEWNTSLKRRTQHYGFTYDYKSKSAIQVASPMPRWCDFLIDRLSILKTRPDQLIVNEYQPGQGISPHVDSPSSFEDGIVSVSLGSDIIMDFTSPSGEMHSII